jgi:hypothetical protein
MDALLRSLYGATVGGHTAAQPADLLAAKHIGQKPLRKTSGLSERDALLITYADQVREDGIAPLRTLATFCEKRLFGVVGGVQPARGAASF